MDDLIYRQAAIDAIHGYFDGMLETDTWSPCDVYGLIEILPSAQPERKKGQWIFIRPTKEDRLYVACDQCGQVEAWDENSGMLCALLGEKYAHYCPNCGADMRGTE